MSSRFTEKYKIIDSHCHIYPDGIARKAVKSVNEFYDGLPTDHHDGTTATLIESGLKCGIDHFVVHSVATSPHQVSSINHFLARSVAASGGRFTGLGTLHLDSEDIERDIDELLSLGLKGVKIHPDIQRFLVNEPKAMRLFEILEDRDIPVCVHTGDYRYDYSTPVRVATVLRTFPKLKFIGAHFGGWSVWAEAVKILPDYPNIIVDSSSTFYWLKPEESRHLIHAYGAERVLFGTDYPFWMQDADLRYLENLDLTDDEYEKILWKNTAELYNI